jgi:acetate kinase
MIQYRKGMHSVLTINGGSSSIKFPLYKGGATAACLSAPIPFEWQVFPKKTTRIIHLG